MTEDEIKKGRAHDAEGARLAIFDAAEEVFAEHGYDGARIDEIARRSGYNKSLIFQYYGDKLSLYTEVVRRADRELHKINKQILPLLFSEDVTSFPEKIRAVLNSIYSGYFDNILEHPHFVRIVLWEMAEKWETFAKIFSEKDREDADYFKPALYKIQEAGLLRPNLHPLVQFALVMHTCVFFLNLLPIYQMVMPDIDLTSKEALKQVRDFFIDFTLQGLIMNPAPNKPGKEG